MVPIYGVAPTPVSLCRGPVVTALLLMQPSYHRALLTLSRMGTGPWVVEGCRIWVMPAGWPVLLSHRGHVYGSLRTVDRRTAMCIKNEADHGCIRTGLVATSTQKGRMGGVSFA